MDNIDFKHIVSAELIREHILRQCLHIAQETVEGDCCQHYISGYDTGEQCCGKYLSRQKTADEIIADIQALLRGA